MLKRLNVFVLIVFLLGQTIIGPIGSTAGLVSADGGEGADKTELEQALEDAEDALKDAEEHAEEDYTEESYGAFADAVTALESSYEAATALEDDATEDEINDAVIRIKTAIDVVKEKVEELKEREDDAESPNNQVTSSTSNSGTPLSLNKSFGFQTLSGNGEGKQYDETVDTSTLVVIEFTINGNEVTDPAEVKNGDTAYFEFKIDDIPAGHNYGPGSTLTVELPEVFTNLQASGSTKFGELITEGRQAILTFNGEVIDGFGDGNTLENIWFKIEATLNKEDDGLDGTVVIPGYGNLDLNFTPKDGVPVSKKRLSDQFQNNADSIEWEVIVNTDYAAKDKANVNFVDFLGDNANHKFKDEDVTVQEVKVSADGGPNNITPVGTAEQKRPTFNNDLTQMTLELDGTKAYKITYKTYPEDPKNDTFVTYENSAKYDGSNPDKDTAHIQYSPPLQKQGASINSSTQEASWEIKVNHNNRTLGTGGQNLKVNDVWTTAGGSGERQQQLVGDIVVKNATTGQDAEEGTHYQINRSPDQQGFEVEFLGEFSDAYTITYKTKPTDGTYISEDMTVSNEVTRSDDPNTFKDDDSVKYTKNAYMLDKKAESVNYENKTMKWKIIANQSGKTLQNGTVFEDRFTPDNNQKLIDNTLTVTSGGATVAHTVTNSSKAGFDLTLNEPVTGEIIIEYDTEYDIKDIGENTRSYRNDVKLTNHGITGMEDPTDGASQTIKGEQKANGEKKGVYNYATKRFEWEVLLNFNYNTFTNAVFEDEIKNGPNQTIDNIVITPGELNANGEFQPGTPIEIANTADAPNKIKLELGGISTPYKITYESYVTNDYIPETTGKLEVENEATLKDGDTPNANWWKKVGVNYTDKLINKKGEQIKDAQGRDSAGITWNFEFNYAQSSLKNIVITDDVGKDDDGNPNQLYVEDSFKVYEVTLSGKSNSKTGGTATVANEPLDKSKYDLSVDIRNGTFELKLPDGDKAYYVEYETIYQGADDEEVRNQVAVQFNDNEGTKDSSSNYHAFSQFRYGAGGDVISVPFIAIKTDASTGKTMEGIDFTLYHAGTDRPLITDTTDEHGIFDIGMSLSEIEYYLKEDEVPGGYQDPGEIHFKLHRDSVATSGPFEGKQVIYIENEPILEAGEKICENFTLTVKDENEDPVKEKDVKLVNKKTGEIYEGTTNNDGEVTKPRAELPAGEYEVYVDGGSEDDTYINDMTVKYIGEDDVGCVDEVSPDTISVSGTKTWKDGDNVDSTRPGSIRVNLFADKEDDTDNPEKYVTVDSDDEWKYEFTNLPKYTKAIGEDKHEVDYTVEEVQVNGYATNYEESKTEEIDGEEVKTINITNVRTSDVPVEVTVTKEWVDNDDATGDRPESIKVNLKQNDKVIETEEIKADANGDWKHTFTDLDEFDVNGVAYEYTVSEHDVPRYASEVNGLEITNTRSEKKSIEITKGWLDDNNPDRPGSIEVELFRSIDGGDKESVGTYTVTGADDWSFTTEELPSFDKDGKAYTYEIEEKDVPSGYDSKVDGFDITNLRVGTTDISGTKTWVNKHNESEALPESITVNLLANGEEVDSVEVTAEDDWKYNFTDLDKYDDEGKEIKYTVTEDAVDGYKTSYDDAQLNITNTKLCENFTVEVRDHEDKPVANEKYTFTSEDGKTKVTGTTDKDGKIVFDREDLPEGTYTVTDKDGNVIGKIVVEYSVDCADNLSIIKLDKAAVKEVSVEEDGDSKLPKTATQIFSYIALGLGLIALGITVKFTRRRKTV